MRPSSFFTVLCAGSLLLGAGCSSSKPEAVSLTAIELTPASASLAKGTTQQVVATGVYSDHTTRDLTASVDWSSSSASVASVSNAEPKGLATAVGVGTAALTATDAESGVQGSLVLTVTPATLVSIAVTPPAPSLAKGTTQQLAATGTFADGTTQDLTGDVTWSSSDASAASFSGAPGLVTALAVGSVTLSATHAAGGVPGSTTLTVTPAVLASLRFAFEGGSLPRGRTQQYAITGEFTDGTTQDLTGSVAWSSSDEGVATISSAGLADAVAVGTTTLRATRDGLEAGTVLTVTPAVLTSLAITPANKALPRGGAKQLRATGSFSDGSTQDVTNSVTWSSSDAAVIAVSNAAGHQGSATASTVLDTVTISAIDPATQVQGSATLSVAKVVFVSSIGRTGDVGIAGADTFCNDASSGKPGTGSFKAMWRPRACAPRATARAAAVATRSTGCWTPAGSMRSRMVRSSGRPPRRRSSPAAWVARSATPSTGRA